LRVLPAPREMYASSEADGRERAEVSPVMKAYGFTVDQAVEFVRKGLANPMPQRVRADAVESPRCESPTRAQGAGEGVTGTHFCG
jgi:hypothetical protein